MIYIHSFVVKYNFNLGSIVPHLLKTKIHRWSLNLPKSIAGAPNLRFSSPWVPFFKLLRSIAFRYILFLARRHNRHFVVTLHQVYIIFTFISLFLPHKHLDCLFYSSQNFLYKNDHNSQTLIACHKTSSILFRIPKHGFYFMESRKRSRLSSWWYRSVQLC